MSKPYVQTFSDAYVCKVLDALELCDDLPVSQYVECLEVIRDHVISRLEEATREDLERGE